MGGWRVRFLGVFQGGIASAATVQKMERLSETGECAEGDAGVFAGVVRPGVRAQEREGMHRDCGKNIAKNKT